MQRNCGCIYFGDWVISVSAAAEDKIKNGEASGDSAASKSAVIANANAVTLFDPAAPAIAGAIESQFPFKAIKPPEITTIELNNMSSSLTVIQVLTLDVRRANLIPLPGAPLYVGPAEPGSYGLQYQGKSVATLAKDDGSSGYFVGVVWSAQPRQTLVHRELLQIAVCTQGACRSRALSEFAGDIVGSRNVIGTTSVTRLTDDGLIFLMQ